MLVQTETVDVVCNLKTVLAFTHNELWRSPDVNSLFVISKNVVVFAHNELWQSPDVNSLFVISKKKMLWSSPTTNYGDRRLQMTT